MAAVITVVGVKSVPGENHKNAGSPGARHVSKISLGKVFKT